MKNHSSFRFASLDDAELDAITGGGDVMPAATTETFQIAAGLDASRRWSPGASFSPSSPSDWGGLQRMPSELATIGGSSHGPALEHLTGWDPSQLAPHDPAGAQSEAVSGHGGGYAHPYTPSDIGASGVSVTGTGGHSGYDGLLEQMGIDPNAVPVQGSSGNESTPNAGTAGFAAGDGGCYSGGGHGTPPAISDAGSNDCNDTPAVTSGCGGGGGGGRHC